MIDMKVLRSVASLYRLVAIEIKIIGPILNVLSKVAEGKVW